MAVQTTLEYSVSNQATPVVDFGTSLVRQDLENAVHNKDEDRNIEVNINIEINIVTNSCCSHN